MAVTAAFSGVDYLAKKQLAKYAAKQVTEKLGEELAERLLKDGADNALIRKAAGELTAAEFERIGSLAKRGLAGELLEKVVDNREVLGKASDSTLLLFKNSTGSCDDIITVLLKHGDEAGQLYGLYGDDVIDIALRYGDEGLGGIRKHGTDFLVEYSAYGDDFVQSYIKNGDEVLELVIRYSDDGMEGIRKYGDKFVELYRSYGDEFAGNYVKYGDDAVDAYVKYGDDAAKVLESGSVPKIEKIQPSLPKGSKPFGNYADDSKRTYKRQNEAADLFASNGYKVEMLDEIPGGNGYGLKETANPDFLIEDKVFDCYSPGAETKPQTIINEIRSKTKDQAPNIVLNLDDYNGNMDELIELIKRKATPEGDLKRLEELRIIKDGEIIDIFD